jgi:hypothetical protein
MPVLSPAYIRVLLAVLGLGLAGTACAQPDLPPDAPSALRQFDTNLDKTTVDLSTLRSGGPPKDGIPSIDAPSFVPIAEARDWIAPKEPVIVIDHEGDVKAYPLQILTHHEIVNDEIGGTPVAVTFCPLCYSSIAFERTLDGEPVTFGVSGLLRHSDLVMYDRKTETLWQQLTGEAIVGDRAGQTLAVVPSQLISFQQVTQNFPDARVLSRNTGHRRPYGQNPYAGYDSVDESPFLYDGPTDDRLPPKEKVVTVSLGNTHKAYPHSVTKKKRVVHDTVAERPLVVFHGPGAVSALDARRIADSKEDGTTGVFDRRVDGRTLTFTYAGDGRFTDDETGSTWTVTGRAVAGPLKGTQLDRIAHGDYFSFAWFAFRPETGIYAPAAGS